MMLLCIALGMSKQEATTTPTSPIVANPRQARPAPSPGPPPSHPPLRPVPHTVPVVSTFFEIRGPSEVSGGPWKSRTPEFAWFFEGSGGFRRLPGAPNSRILEFFEGPRRLRDFRDLRDLRDPRPLLRIFVIYIYIYL